MAEAKAGLSRRERRKREVRERIAEAAMRRFVLQGFDETTVDEIAADAGVAQKTFFNYFPTKQALFRELAEARIEELQVILEEERDRTASTAQKLEHCFQRLAQLLEQRRLLARDLILEVMRARTPGTTGDELSKLHASFAALLRDGQAAGDVRRDHPVEFLAEVVMGVYFSLMNNWVNLADYPLKDRLAQSAALLSEAISPSGTRFSPRRIP